MSVKYKLVLYRHVLISANVCRPPFHPHIPSTLHACVHICSILAWTIVVPSPMVSLADYLDVTIDKRSPSPSLSVVKQTLGQKEVR